jgi:Transposase DNA-binding
LGRSIPLVCQDWANTKAAYRFFSNDRVSEEEILTGHFQSTRDRIAANGGPLLLLHDTTEFSFQREKPHAIGGPVAGLVGIEGGVVSGVFNLESPGVRAPGRRPPHDQRYHEA